MLWKTGETAFALWICVISRRNLDSLQNRSDTLLATLLLRHTLWILGSIMGFVINVVLRPTQTHHLLHQTNVTILLTCTDLSSIDSLAETTMILWWGYGVAGAVAILAVFIGWSRHFPSLRHSLRRLLLQSAPLSPVVGESKLDSIHFCTHSWWLPLSFTAFTFGIAFFLCAGQQMIGAMCR